MVVQDKYPHITSLVEGLKNFETRVSPMLEREFYQRYLDKTGLTSKSMQTSSKVSALIVYLQEADLSHGYTMLLWEAKGFGDVTRVLNRLLSVHTFMRLPEHELRQAECNMAILAILCERQCDYLSTLAVITQKRKA